MTELKSIIMKVFIQLDGKMVVSAENQLEGYALAKWWEGWHEKKTEAICIQTNPSSSELKEITLETEKEKEQ